jgi:serine/threonine protein kinase
VPRVPFPVTAKEGANAETREHGTALEVTVSSTRPSTATVFLAAFMLAARVLILVGGWPVEESRESNRLWKDVPRLARLLRFDKPVRERGLLRMNVQRNPWSNSWEVLKKLGKGGQGETSLVKSISDANRLGVLKTLKNNRNPQARSRFQIEVSILEALAYRGIKVPTVFESNTDRFNDEGTPLYFVMQYIDGHTLEEVVRTDGPLSLERASAMVLDLGDTMAAAHNEGVFHRDLKPANIIVRNAEAADLVVVDYGLSFNSAEDVETITKSGEQFRDEFLAPGETSTPGGNTRDLRIDVTALCAVLYFGITGHFPGQMLDGRARPPHRRDGAYSIRHHISDDYRCNQVEMLFDRGFAPDIERRFQTCSELTTRLRDVLAAPRNKPQDPAVLAAFCAQQLLAKARPENATTNA